jgi:hypothetical protein
MIKEIQLETQHLEQRERRNHRSQLWRAASMLSMALWTPRSWGFPVTGFLLVTGLSTHGIPKKTKAQRNISYIII